MEELKVLQALLSAMGTVGGGGSKAFAQAGQAAGVLCSEAQSPCHNAECPVTTGLREMEGAFRHAGPSGVAARRCWKERPRLGLQEQDWAGGALS